MRSVCNTPCIRAKYIYAYMVAQPTWLRSSCQDQAQSLCLLQKKPTGEIAWAGKSKVMVTLSSSIPSCPAKQPLVATNRIRKTYVADIGYLEYLLSDHLNFSCFHLSHCKEHINISTSTSSPNVDNTPCKTAPAPAGLPFRAFCDALTLQPQLY